MPSPADFTSFGLLDAGRDEVGRRLLGAWDAFLAVAEAADLNAKTRLPGWRAHEICVHLGHWDDHQAVPGLIAAARETKEGGQPSAPAPVDEANAKVTEAHRGASRDEVLTALRRHRDDIADYLAQDDDSLDRVPTMATVGPLPLLTVLSGEAYELAVHALDLHDAGAPAPSDELRDSGLATLMDVMGALAARQGITAAVGVRSELAGWGFDAGERGWQTSQIGASDEPSGALISGETDLLLDTSSGRRNPAGAVLRRKLKVSGIRVMLRLTPLVESVPGIPGGPVLKAAAKTLSKFG